MSNMAVKTYSLKADGNKYCSAHTQVKEMRSKDGADKVLIDTNLMTMIEKLFTKLQCSKYIISSGYRTPAHDKAVGGNGSGQHTKGTAVDCCFYWKDGSIIPAPIVCCVAQDLGFKGIANISTLYRYVHLDMRTSGTYYGNEIISYNTVTNDFYKYFGVSKADVAKYTGETPKKSITEIAKEVISGKWGNGAERKKKLTSAGYNYNQVQAEVEKLLNKSKPTAPKKKSNEEIAREVIQGKWGNGAARKQRLEKAGYNYSAIQKLVNKAK
jgi:hypothetical protein